MAKSQSNQCALVPAVAYYRMSSDKQEASIADQREAVRAYAKQNGYHLIDEYADEGISGWRDDRKQFQKLIADCKGGTFKAVLCWDQDRFSRFPVLEANHYWFLLDKAGVHISTIAQGRLDFSDLAGWLTASISQHAKSEYCRDLARNTSRGLRKRKLAGDWVGSAPLGYSLVNGRLAIGDAQAVETVRTIFRLRAAGYGYLGIAKKLNAKGIATPRGKCWSQFSVKHILQRDAYLGAVVIGKHSRAKYERLTDGIVRIENAHPAIIDQKLWDDCREQDKRLHKAHTRNGSEGAKLGGLLRCGCCGSVMYAIQQSKWRYYVCGSYHCKGECHRCAIPAERADRLIIGKIADLLVGNYRDKLRAKVAKLLEAKQDDTAERNAIVRTLADIDRKLAAAMDRLLTVNNTLVGSIESKMMELQEQRAALERKLSEGKRKPTLTADGVMHYLDTLKESLKSASALKVRTALSQVIESVQIDFKYSGTSAKGRISYQPTGGEIKLLSKGCQQGER